MDFRDSEEEQQFRHEVREWIEDNLPSALRGDAGEGEWGQLASGHERDKDALAEWRRRLQTRGWVAPAWPQEYGGAHLPVMQQFILKEELAVARAPRFGGAGIGWVAPTLMSYGEPWMKDRFIHRILTGEERWCQGFSEPGAGSDLANVQTRAARDGDEYVVNGQKIWTSGAHIADWMILLARTDPKVPKHKGLTYFVLDMGTPGITMSPLINMVGNHGFNQVFFDDVRIPAVNVVGEVDRGWYVAAHTLDHERSLVDLCVEYRTILLEVSDWAKHTWGSAVPLNVRRELSELAIDIEVARNLSLRIVSMQAKEMTPNYEASIVKLFASELEQRMATAFFRTGGLFSQLTDRGDERPPLSGRVGRFQLHSAAATIGGGTSEIQRGIIATRGLGLPRE